MEGAVAEYSVRLPFCILNNKSTQISHFGQLTHLLRGNLENRLVFSPGVFATTSKVSLLLIIHTYPIQACLYYGASEKVIETFERDAYFCFFYRRNQAGSIRCLGITKNILHDYPPTKLSYWTNILNILFLVSCFIFFPLL